MHGQKSIILLSSTRLFSQGIEVKGNLVDGFTCLFGSQKGILVIFSQFHNQPYTPHSVYLYMYTNQLLTDQAGEEVVYLSDTIKAEKQDQHKDITDSNHSNAAYKASGERLPKATH